MSKHSPQRSDFTDGFNLLMLRAEEGNIEEIHRILTENHSYDVNSMNRNGSTALSIATKNGNFGIVELLIQAGSDVNLPNNSGQTPLFLSCWNNHSEIARLLIDNGADINAVDQRGWTSLMIAAYHGHIEIVRLLLEYRADIEIQDCFGKKAIDRAREQPILDILSEAHRAAQANESKSLQVNPFSPKYSPKTRFTSNLSNTNTVSAKKLPQRNSSRAMLSPAQINSPVNQSITSKDTSRRSLSHQRNRSDARKSAKQSPLKSVLSPSNKQTPRKDNNAHSQSQTNLNGTGSPSMKRAMFKDEMIKLLSDQMATFSEKLQRLVDSRVGLQVPMQIAHFEGNLKRELDSVMKTRANHLFKTIQSTLNLKLKFLLHRLGYDQHVDLTPFTEDEIHFGSINFTEEPIKQIEEKEMKALEKDTIQLEKSIIFNTKNVSLGASTILDATMGSDKELEFRSFSHKAQIKQDILDSVNNDIRSTTQYVVDYSNSKIGETVRQETNLLQKKILNELVNNFELIEEEMKNKFEDFINRKVGEISTLLSFEQPQARKIPENTPSSYARPSSGTKPPQVSKFKFEPERPTGDERESYQVRPSRKSPERSTSTKRNEKSFSQTRERIENIKSSLNFLDSRGTEGKSPSMQSTVKFNQSEADERSQTIQNSDRKMRDEYPLKEENDYRKPRIEPGETDAKTKIEELRAFYQKKYSTAKKSNVNDSPGKLSSSGAFSRSALKSPTYDGAKFRLGSDHGSPNRDFNE